MGVVFWGGSKHKKVHTSYKITACPACKTNRSFLSFVLFAAHAYCDPTWKSGLLHRSHYSRERTTGFRSREEWESWIATQVRVLS